MKTVEYCTNNEWLYVFGPVAGIEAEDNERPDLAIEYRRAANDFLRADPRADGIDLSPAHERRRLLHAWNGTQFKYSCGGFGTFAELTDSEKAAIVDADTAGIAAATTAAKSWR